MSLGIKQSKDQAGSAIGCFWSPNNIDPKNQTRSSARSAYFDDFQVSRPNLHAITQRHVTKLLTQTANGVVTVTGVQYAKPNCKTLQVVRARKQYILSAGAVHDPQILQLSGIGPKPLLGKLGVKVAVDLPGVGSNLQDHPYGGLILKLANVFPSPIDLETDAAFDAEQRALFYKNRTGTWTAGAPNSVAFLPLADFTDKAAALLAAYTAQAPDAHLRAGSDARLLAGFAKQRAVLLKHLATPSMAGTSCPPSARAPPR